MIRIPDKILKLSPYDPTENIYKIKLDANESFATLPQELKQKVADVMLTMDFNRYPDPAVTKTNELAAKDFGVNANCVVAGNGSDELITVLLNTFCPKGSKIMVLNPDFSMYKLYAEIYEVAVCSANKDSGFHISVDYVIERALEEKPQALIFSNPCNPAGQGFTREEVKKMIEALPDTLVIADEAYMEFWNESILPESVEMTNVLVLKTMSKAYGMAGIRLGFVVGNPLLINEVNKSRSPFNVNSLTQAVAEIALEDTTWIKTQIAEIVENKQQLENDLIVLSKKYDSFEIIKTFTNFAIIRTKYCDEIYNKLLQKSICVRNFAKMDFLRITTGSKEENAEFLTAFEEIVKGGF